MSERWVMRIFGFGVGENNVHDDAVINLEANDNVIERAVL